jgi:hypothetical protein
MVAAELNGKVEQLFRIQRRINPPSSSGFPADRRYQASQVSKNRANALLMWRVIGEVGGDVKPEERDLISPSGSFSKGEA